MAEPDRQTSDSLAAEMALRPHEFNFFQAVRRLEAEHRAMPAGRMVGPAGGRFFAFLPDSVSFFCSLEHSKALNSVNGLVRMYVNFLGMFGPNGPLPQQLTDFARDRLRNAHDPTLVRFMDIFHQRMLSFFYRAWASNEKSVDFDRADEARYADYFGSLFGIGIPSLRDRDSVSDWTKIHFAGRLSAQTRNAEGLEAILADFFAFRRRSRSSQGTG